MIKIIVDSGADYLPEELTEKRIEMVPLQLYFGTESYMDGITLTREDFYKKLTGGDHFPKTSQPSPSAFLEYFEEARKNRDEVICILISSALSGTYQSAVTAKQIADYDKIYLVDSGTASVGVQFLSDRASTLRDEGKSAEEIVKELEALRERIRVYFVVDTLEYLYRGGRLSRSGAMAGRLVNMKPVLTLKQDGGVGVSDICLGTSRAIKALTGHLRTEEPDSDYPLYSLYSLGLKNCEKMEAQIREQQLKLTGRKQIGSAIGAHIGPNATGVFYVKK